LVPSTVIDVETAAYARGVATPDITLSIIAMTVNRA
jgi:hypothetical protein